MNATEHAFPLLNYRIRNMGVAVWGDLAVWGPINVTEHHVAESPLYDIKYLPHREQLSLMIWLY